MNAVISGQAGVAVLVDGLKLASIHAGSDGEAIGRRPEEIRFLLNDARDLEFVKSIGQAEAARRLEIATSKYDALHIALILLDGELADDLTARDLAEVWATTEQTINRWVRAGFPKTLGALWDKTAWIVEGPRTKRLPVSALDQKRLSEAQKTRLLELRRRRALSAPPA